MTVKSRPSMRSHYQRDEPSRQRRFGDVHRREQRWQAHSPRRFASHQSAQPRPIVRRFCTQVDDRNNNDIIPSLPDDVRSIDGTGNNLENPDLGSTGEQLIRIADADYADGISDSAGADRPSAREISNELSEFDGETFSDRNLSAFIYVWGQFIDHDFGLTEEAEDAESFAIEVPYGRSFFRSGRQR